MRFSECREGGRVRIKNVELGQHAGGYVFIENMKKYCGTVSKIIEVQDWVVRLECTGNNTGWMPEWLTIAEYFFKDEDENFEI